MATAKTTKTDPTIHVYFILDRSGSMQTIASDVIGGYNKFIADQKKVPGECLLTLVQFDDMDPYEVIYTRQSVTKVKKLTAETFQPRGSTPLYDCMGKTIINAIADHKEHKDEKVLFVTFTDGMENASREWTHDKVFALCTKQQKKGWTFVYLGANQDAYAVGGGLGYAQGSTQTWTPTHAGTQVAMAAVSASTTAYRGTGGAYTADFFADTTVTKKPATTKKPAARRTPKSPAAS